MSMRNAYKSYTLCTDEGVYVKAAGGMTFHKQLAYQFSSYNDADAVRRFLLNSRGEDQWKISPGST